MKPKEKLYSTQKSVFYYLSHYRETDQVLASRPDFNGLYAERLIKDVSLGIMPIGGKTKKKDFKVIISPSNKEIQDLISKGITRDDYRINLASEVCKFFEECVHTILSYGEADYEIAFLSRQDGGENIEFKLELIPPTTLVQQKDKYYQYLPKELADINNLPQYIPLSECDILRFQVPSYLQDELRYVLDSLISLSKRPTLPEFFLNSIDGNPNQVPFDITAFNYSHNLALAEAGKSIGWNSFVSPDSGILEYYNIYRFLLFEKFKINLRNSILSTFNEGLHIIGQRLGFSAELGIEGLPSIEDANIALSKLSDGNISFNEIIDQFSTL